MLSGERPFQKSHEQALIYSILNDKPESVSSIRSDISEYFIKAINKALEKDSSNRYQSAKVFIQDLQQPQEIAYPRAKKSIAVLPFEDMSPGKSQEYFCDGIA